MPIVTIDLWSGRTREQKERLAAEITQSMVKVLEVKPETVQIRFNDFKRSNWAIKGELQGED